MYPETRTDFRSLFQFWKYCSLPGKLSTSSLQKIQFYILVWQPAHMVNPCSSANTWLLEFSWLSWHVLVIHGAKFEAFIPKTFGWGLYEADCAYNMVCSQSAGGLWPWKCCACALKKLIHWYVTSVGLLAVYPNKARAPCLSIWRPQTWSAVSRRVRQPADLSRFSEQWKVAQPLVRSAFYLTLVGLMFSGGWDVGGESY